MERPSSNSFVTCILSLLNIISLRPHFPTQVSFIYFFDFASKALHSLQQLPQNEHDGLDSKDCSRQNEHTVWANTKFLEYTCGICTMIGHYYCIFHLSSLYDTQIHIQP